MKINREAYEKLIEEDIRWLLQHPDTLERDHIEQVLYWSIDALYPPAAKQDDKRPRGL